MLRAYLHNNPRLEIVLFNAFLAARHGDLLRRTLPQAMTSPAGHLTHGNSSLWLKVRGNDA